MQVEILNKLEEKIISKLKKSTKNHTKEQVQKEYEIAKRNFNNYSSNENMTMEERYIKWTELETIYRFWADKLEEIKGVDYV